jgi:hypothetical protein
VVSVELGSTRHFIVAQTLARRPTRSCESPVIFQRKSVKARRTPSPLRAAQRPGACLPAVWPLRRFARSFASK